MPRYLLLHVLVSALVSVSSFSMHMCMQPTNTPTNRQLGPIADAMQRTRLHQPKRIVYDAVFEHDRIIIRPKRQPRKRPFWDLLRKFIYKIRFNLTWNSRWHWFRFYCVWPIYAVTASKSLACVLIYVWPILTNCRNHRSPGQIGTTKGTGGDVLILEEGVAE